MLDLRRTFEDLSLPVPVYLGELFSPEERAEQDRNFKSYLVDKNGCKDFYNKPEIKARYKYGLGGTDTRLMPDRELWTEIQKMPSDRVTELAIRNNRDFPEYYQGRHETLLNSELTHCKFNAMIFILRYVFNLSFA
jgi:hypothetical protein